MVKVFVFGNEFLSFDSMARRVSMHLPKDIEIVECRSPDEILDEEDLIILDVAKGIEKTAIIKSDKLKTRSIVTAHDFDLGFFLKLLNSIGKKKKVKIIAVPMEGDAKKIAGEVEECIRECCMC
ncbi:hypothetical protein J4401_06680 [Candidatus Woesearchaeota archaeon]|nr:hypothetical protein [Candidatus Woesearchaeota archaeon]